MVEYRNDVHFPFYSLFLFSFVTSASNVDAYLAVIGHYWKYLVRAFFLSGCPMIPDSHFSTLFSVVSIV